MPGAGRRAGAGRCAAVAHGHRSQEERLLPGTMSGFGQWCLVLCVTIGSRSRVEGYTMDAVPELIDELR